MGETDLIERIDRLERMVAYLAGALARTRPTPTEVATRTYLGLKPYPKPVDSRTMADD